MLAHGLLLLFKKTTYVADRQPSCFVYFLRYLKELVIDVLHRSQINVAESKSRLVT